MDYFFLPVNITFTMWLKFDFFITFFNYPGFVLILDRRCGMIANKTTLHKRQNDTEINNYHRSLYGHQQ